MIYGEILKIIHFYHFDSDPRFPHFYYMLGGNLGSLLYGDVSVMVVLVTCKYEEDPIKNEDARVLTSLLFDFSDAQGQLTP